MSNPTVYVLPGKVSMKIHMLFVQGLQCVCVFPIIKCKDILYQRNKFIMKLLIESDIISLLLHSGNISL